MPRYIDADKLLARYKERCAGCKETPNFCEHFCDIADVISDIEDAPTEDIVEVVRCKDCRYECGDACLHALGLAAIESPECYCAYGERKEKTDVGSEV